MPGGNPSPSSRLAGATSTVNQIYVTRFLRLHGQVKRSPSLDGTGDAVATLTLIVCGNAARGDGVRL
jgi:hypothetical protein